MHYLIDFYTLNWPIYCTSCFHILHLLDLSVGAFVCFEPRVLLQVISWKASAKCGKAGLLTFPRFSFAKDLSKV